MLIEGGVMKAIIVRTNNLLSDPQTPLADLKKLVKELKGAMEFDLALKVLARMEEQVPEDLWVQQQKALCTYKNDDEHVSIRLPKALKILEGIGLRDPDLKEPETLGLGGAVYKRFWEYRGRLEDIYTALALYRRGWECDPEKDMGYCGVNAAYILDVLAYQAKSAAMKASSTDSESQALTQQANDLRKHMQQKIRSVLAEKKEEGDYWHPVTLAEICLGLNEYDAAGTYLEKAAKLPGDAWERQTTVKQYISIAKMQGAPIPRPRSDPSGWHPAWKALRKLLDKDTEGAIRSHRGKVGLALSGGGFRASLFHLGVLARLAETDMLRSVEVISTVSGGSIVGAHYYLELKLLLETRRDEELIKDDYVALVRRVHDNFLAAAQKNLRMRAIGGLWPNLKMLFLPGYTRSIRLAELYQYYIYNTVPLGPAGVKPSAMQELMIAPAGEGPSEEFSLARANWRRGAKVPVLLINATSLNSGHNYHFTARFMGEPPALTGIEVDMNARYRRVYYEDLCAEPEFCKYPIGRAVAASACVPGLFEPVELRGLYPGKQVRLVDGGVHDNQGVAGLLDEGCSIILCSDASGQMDDQSSPPSGRLGVLLRSNSILQDRIREAEYQELSHRVDTGSLEGLFFVHLKKDLDLDPVDWVDCEDRSPVKDRPTATPYNIDRDLQRSLANIRTDLDSFTDVEAYALMLSGYEMTQYQFGELAKGRASDARDAQGDNEAGAAWHGFAVGEPGVEWPFLKLRDLMSKPHDSSDERRKDLGRQLNVGRELAFKVWRLSPVLKAISIVLALAAAGAAVWWLARNWNVPFEIRSFTPWQFLLVVGLPLAALAMPALAWLAPQRKIMSILFSIGLVLGGWLASWLHRSIFDRMFLRRGSLKRLMRLSSKG